ncbi:hypothetical protein ACHQM5_010748 [Ranunculus cassubicifolius]
MARSSSISNAVVAILVIVLISVSQVVAHNGVDHGHHAPEPSPTKAPSAAAGISASSMVTALFVSVGFIVSML